MSKIHYAGAVMIASSLRIFIAHTIWGAFTEEEQDHEAYLSQINEGEFKKGFHDRPENYS